MNLDSYLEIFTTLYGWAFANMLGGIVTGTGLVALPFGLIIFNAWRDIKERGDEGVGAVAVIEAAQVRLIIALFVMTMAFFTSPMSSLVNVNLTYKPQPTALDPNPAQVTRQGGTGTGFDAAMSDSADGSMSAFNNSSNLLYVPVWWYGVMSISSGINNAFRDGLRASGRDMRVVEEMARAATIEDPVLLKEVQRFYSECFIPARSAFLRADPSTFSSAGAAIISPTASPPQGPTDTDWIGSRFYRTEPGYYGTMRSKNPVSGFAVNTTRDQDYAITAEPGSVEANYTQPEFGRPTCNEWWVGSSNSLRTKLVQNSVSIKGVVQAVTNMPSTSDLPPDNAADYAVRIAFNKANPGFLDNDRFLGSDYDGWTTLTQTVAGGASTVGVFKEWVKTTVAIIPLFNALPMIQALILMGMYAFLPLLVFLSGYDLKVMLIGAIAVFTVKFWTVMWLIAMWVDAHLIAAMYPGAQGNLILNEITEILSFRTGQGQLYKRMILNMLLIGMFVGLPVLWSAMMAWVGHNIGTAVAAGMKSFEQRAAGVASGSKTAMPRSAGKPRTK